MALRMVSYDVGKTCTGVVIADVHNATELTIIDMYVLQGQAKEMRTLLVEHAKDVILNQIQNHNALVIYENIYTPKRFYANYEVIRLNKMLRKFYEDKGVPIKSLLPSQKVSMIPGARSKDRKKRSEDYALRCLNGEMKAKFQSFNRRHDVADALLGILYMQTKKM